MLHSRRLSGIRTCPGSQLVVWRLPGLIKAALAVALALPVSTAPAQTLPTLPQAAVDTILPAVTGNTYPVNAGGNLQIAFNQAAAADPTKTHEVVLKAGATFTGNFTLPPRAAGTGWVIIRSSALGGLPPEGTRATPAHAEFMPKIVSPNDAPVLQTAAGAHRYRFLGVEFTLAAGLKVHYNMLQLGTASQNAIQIPSHLILDRCYLHGHPGVEVQRGIALNSASTAVLDSTIADIHMVGTETQAIAGWNGPGPFKIVNNYLEGAGVNVLFGGADPSIPNLVPSDIELRHNHFSKPLSWKPNEPTYAGRRWTAKNLLEIKAGRRLRVDGNVFEYSWADAQEGWAIRVVLGSDAYAAISDLTFTNNLVRHAAYGLDICGNCSTATSVVSRVLVQNNLFTDISPTRWTSYSGAGGALMLRSGARDITVRHNTMLQDGTFLVFTGARLANIRLTDNLGNHGPYGVFGDGGTTGTAALDQYVTGWTFTKNALIAPTVPASLYPAGNFFPASVHSLGFVDPERRDYRLSGSSPFRTASTDGGHLGVDMDRLPIEPVLEGKSTTPSKQVTIRGKRDANEPDTQGIAPAGSTGKTTKPK